MGSNGMFKGIGALASAAALLILSACPNPTDSAAVPQPVSLLAIPGVAVPAAYRTPVSAVSTVQYTGTVVWSPTMPDGYFEPGVEYTATISLAPKPGYTTEGLGANSFTVAGAAEVSHAANSGVVQARFPEAKSDNADLVALTVEGGFTLSPAFSESVTAYTVVENVPNGTSAIRVTGSPSDPSATMTNSGEPQALAVGMNTLTLGVTAQDGSTTKHYTVRAFRLGPDGTSAGIGELTYVPAGRFRRGAAAGDISVITQPYLMSRHEISRAQFLARMGTDPSNTTQSSGTNDPVQQVSWYHAVAFANKLSVHEGLTPVYAVAGISDWSALTYDQIPRALHTTGTEAAWSAISSDWTANGYRLPTEMEWMWAAMGAPVTGQGGGTDTAGWQKAFAGWKSGSDAQDYAWYNANAEGTTRPVGGKLANELGLYDMSGNAAEWVWDRGDWASGYPSGTLTDYRGASSGAERILRGGSFTSPANDGGFAMDDLRIRSRDGREPDNWNPSWGFRLVRPAP